MNCAGKSHSYKGFLLRLPLYLLTPGHHRCSNYSSPNVSVLWSRDVVTCKASAKSCSWPGTTVMAQSRGQALETHLERQSCFQPSPPCRAAVLHRSGSGRNISPQSCVLDNIRMLLEGNSAVRDGKSAQKIHTGPPPGMDHEQTKAAELSRDPAWSCY